MRSKFTPIAFIFLLFLVVSCGNSDSNKARNSSGSGKDTVSEELLIDVDADSIQDVILSYKGDKAVLVNVWATWCIPCIEEFPEIVEIQEEYKDELQVVFVSADFPEDRQRAVKFLKEHNVDWTTYFKDAKDEPFINALSKEWSGALPFTKIISTNGEEVAHWENKASFDKFNTHVKQAIKL